jgi:hypothetical protein
VGGVGLLQLGRPQAQEAQPVGGQGGPGGQQLHGGQVLVGEGPAVRAAQGEHAHGPAFDHHRAPGLGPGGQGPPGDGRGPGQLAVAGTGAERPLATGARRSPGRPGLPATLLQHDRALGGLQGPAGTFQQGGAGRGQVLAAGQDPERGQQLRRRTRRLRSAHVLSSSSS